ncbi:MAG: hypothetical protein HQK60_08755, partial [Deltaproteobacteria bacterium]|nr:hypothetical protein [Deltaproteobacteria bacterium]
MSEDFDGEYNLPLSAQMTWVLVGIIALVVLVILLAVFNHDKAKPKLSSDKAVAVIQALTVREWKPGMGPQPWIYHPAAFKEPVWRPLPP